MLISAQRAHRYTAGHPGRQLTPKQRRRIAHKRHRDYLADVDDHGCCGLDDDGHDGPCAWKCTGCFGSGDCPECRGTGGSDDVVQCEHCDGTGACPDGCHDGWLIDEVPA
jgi:hypothetical protein